MKVKYDKEVDILYIMLSDKPDIILDYAFDGSIVAIEIIGASKKFPNPNKVEYEFA
jgi:uncharacterized protein YuzE